MGWELGTWVVGKVKSTRKRVMGKGSLYNQSSFELAGDNMNTFKMCQYNKEEQN